MPIKISKYEKSAGGLVRAVYFLGVSMCFILCGCGKTIITQKAAPDHVRSELGKMAPVELACDLSGISAADQAALVKLVQAAHLIDEVFLMQVGIR